MQPLECSKARAEAFEAADQPPGGAGAGNAPSSPSGGKLSRLKKKGLTEPSRPLKAVSAIYRGLGKSISGQDREKGRSTPNPLPAASGKPHVGGRPSGGPGSETPGTETERRTRNAPPQLGSQASAGVSCGFRMHEMKFEQDSLLGRPIKPTQSHDLPMRSVG